MTEQNTHIQDQELNVDELATINGGFWNYAIALASSPYTAPILAIGGIAYVGSKLAKSVTDDD